MTEAALQRAVIELAQYCGFRVAHFRAARVQCRACGGSGRTKHGVCSQCKGAGSSWRTPVQAEGAGFPDLVMVKGPVPLYRPPESDTGYDVTLALPGRVIVAELKAGRNKPTEDQQDWLDAFAAAGVEAYLWHERDWQSGEIERILQRREAMEVRG